jgi:hypothetical protein
MQYKIDRARMVQNSRYCVCEILRGVQTLISVVWTILSLCYKSQTVQIHYMLNNNNNSIQFFINVASPEQSGQ